MTPEDQALLRQAARMAINLRLGLVGHRDMSAETQRASRIAEIIESVLRNVGSEGCG